MLEKVEIHYEPYEKALVDKLLPSFTEIHKNALRGSGPYLLNTLETITTDMALHLLYRVFLADHKLVIKVIKETNEEEKARRFAFGVLLAVIRSHSDGFEEVRTC